MWAVIGGSGFEKFDGFETIEELDAATPFGEASSGLRRVKIGENEALFLSRHGAHHEMLPTEVNYRANIWALKKHGAKAILSFSAIGSLQKELKPGDLVVPDQYIDRTKGIRNHTFCGDGLVGHMSLAKPICPSFKETLQSKVNGYDFDTHFDKTYVCIEGPNFSTAAESKMYRQWGADIIGMTNYPEFALAREAGLSYGPCCFVTDYDCWDDSIPHVTLEAVLEVMRNNNAKAFQIAKDMVATPAPTTAADQGLKFGVMTPKDAIPADKRQWLSVLQN